MNDYSRIRRAGLSPPSSKQTNKVQPQNWPYARRAVRYALLGVLGAAAVYFLLSATTAVLITAALLGMGIIVLLVVFGLWVQNNTPL